MTLRPGAIVGPYCLLFPLGKGGMGEVWAAMHTVLEQERALKFMHPSLMQHATAGDRVRHEARGLARVSHPNVIRLHEAFNYQGTVVLAMDLIEGGSLTDVLEARRMPWPEGTSELRVLMLKAMGQENVFV